MLRELEVALDLARRAGEAILEVYEGQFSPHTDVEEKAGGEGPVTIADRRADRLIRDGLRRAFPSDALLTEEHPDDLVRLAHRRLWIVDPLDGTRQFVARGTEFAVMIGLAVEGRALLGVVHLPCEGVTYAAAAGEGAVLLGPDRLRRALRVPEQPANGDALTIAISRSHFGGKTQRVVEALAPARVVTSGSVGRKAALVASGEVDLYISMSTRSRHWDACAPEVVVREAGGVFRDARGRELVYNTQETHNAAGLLACRAGLLARAAEAANAVFDTPPPGQR